MDTQAIIREAGEDALKLLCWSGSSEEVRMAARRELSLRREPWGVYEQGEAEPLATFVDAATARSWKRREERTGYLVLEVRKRVRS